MSEKRVETRNVVGGPVRNGNKNPGHPDLRAAGGGHPRGKTAETKFREIFGDATDEEAKAASAKSFKAWMTDEKRVRVLDAMQKQAENGNVQAANLLLNRDMGVPTSSLDVTDKTPLRGKDVRAAVRKAVAAERETMVANGVDVTIVDRALAAGIWRNEDEPGPEPDDAA